MSAAGRVYNFCAGPATLPLPVLEQVREELLNWRGAGMSVMEVSHRSQDFIELARQSESKLRALLNISDDYAVLFQQGGARMQFAAVPLNLSASQDVVDYLDTGWWSSAAIKEARRVGSQVNVVASGSSKNYLSIPSQDEWQLSIDATAQYFHYVHNETINGLEFAEPPNVGDVPLVADMSSCLLSRPIDVERFALIYAGAQKNIGPAGLALVVVRRDLIGRARATIPSLMDYAVADKSGSMHNTPPTFVWYVISLVLDWLDEQGGLSAMAAVNQRKAEKLYAAIDASSLFCNQVDPSMRSRMNVPFTVNDESLQSAFLKAADARGLRGLRGHRTVGGFRASLYNAMPESGVDALIDFMRDFEQQKA